MSATPAKHEERISKFKDKYRKIRALMIDIDDTIAGQSDPALQSTRSFFDLLADAAVKFSGMAEDEAKRRIEKIKADIRWWHWSDFIIDLGLNPKQFWDFAYEHEVKYIGAMGPDLLPSLKKFKKMDYLLYITSNNPSSGILHKLRLAGIGHINGAPMFHQLLGVTEVHNMKWEPIYWKKVLAHTALDADEVAVIGDNPRDDYEMPHSVGISCSFIVNRKENRVSQSEESLIFCSDFSQIVKFMKKARS